MDTPVIAAVTLAAALVTGAAAFAAGRLSRGRPAVWLRVGYAAVMVAGTGAAAAGAMLGSRALTVAALASIGAGLTGLKYGHRGIVTGPPAGD